MQNHSLCLSNSSLLEMVAVHWIYERERTPICIETLTKSCAYILCRQWVCLPVCLTTLIFRFHHILRFLKFKATGKYEVHLSSLVLEMGCFNYFDKFVKHFIQEYQGDASVANVLSVQAWGWELSPFHLFSNKLYRRPQFLVIPVLWRWRQACAWGSESVSCRFSEKLSSQNKVDTTWGMTPFHRHAHQHMYINMHTCYMHTHYLREHFLALEDFCFCIVWVFLTIIFFHNP